MNLRPFQIILLAVFGFMALAALVLLSSYQSTQSTEELAYGQGVEIWGTFDVALVDTLFQNIAQEDKAFSVVRYERIDAANFDNIFVNAIAEGRSPDMIMLSSEDLVKHRTKLLAIPYTSLPIGSYRDTYVDGAEIFAMSDGIYALPFAVDPLVMFWNRDIFASNGIALPPTTWEQVAAEVVPKTTRRDQNRDVTQSAIAFGEYRNVYRAKDMLMLLALQSGSASVTENERGYTVNLNQAVDGSTRAPLDAAVQFFTDFSNANSAAYTWNRALPLDTQAFLSGDLALYFGRGSEAQGINNKNPNLNFDIAPLPQGGNASAQRGYGVFYGFAIPKASGNRAGAFAAANRIMSPKHADALTAALNMSPVRRDLIAAGSGNPFRAMILRAALIARGWLDPNPTVSDTIFTRMVEDVVSNRSRIGLSVSDAVSRLVLEYR